jgi:purine catabolism regulator
MSTTLEPLESLAPALSVRQVLLLERVLAGEPEVVAGAGQLDRAVRWVHVAEAADVGVMLSGGEMVLTTGVLLAGDDDKQAEYIRSLHRAEASAVVLGLGRAFPTPPDVMRRAAERCGLPMVVLHRPFPFAELTEEVQARLVRRKFAAVSMSEAVRTALTGLITAGAPLQRMLDEIAHHSGCPVVVTNLAHRVLATAGERSAVDDVLRDWERIARQAGGSEGDGWIRAELAGRGEPNPSSCTACSAAPPRTPGRNSPRRACSPTWSAGSYRLGSCCPGRGRPDCPSTGAPSCRSSCGTAIRPNSTECYGCWACPASSPSSPTGPPPYC